MLINWTIFWRCQENARVLSGYRKNNHRSTQWVHEVILLLWVPILFRKEVLPNNTLVLSRKISPTKYASEKEFIDFYWEELEQLYLSQIKKNTLRIKGEDFAFVKAIPHLQFKLG
jgi:hypothetical protein